MDTDRQGLVSVFHSNNAALFESAKHLLGNHGIKYFPTGEYSASAVYGLDAMEIKVFGRDEVQARKVLSELVEERYSLNDKFDKKAKSNIGYVLIAAILFLVAGMFAVFVFLKQ